jgi:hypothetical protein
MHRMESGYGDWHRHEFVTWDSETQHTQTQQAIADMHAALHYLMQEASHECGSIPSSTDNTMLVTRDSSESTLVTTTAMLTLLWYPCPKRKEDDPEEATSRRIQVRALMVIPLDRVAYNPFLYHSPPITAMLATCPMSNTQHGVVCVDHGKTAFCYKVASMKSFC